jgi:hypothetical protein
MVAAVVVVADTAEVAERSRLTEKEPEQAHSVNSCDSPSCPHSAESWQRPCPLGYQAMVLLAREMGSVLHEAGLQRG